MRPANLRGSANALGGADLAWDPLPITANYQVFKRDVTAQEAEFVEVFIPNPGATTATVPDLAHDHTYEFKVSATNGGGESPASGVISVTAHYTAPVAPTGLRATANGDGTVQLDWTAPPGNLWYWIYQRDVTAGEESFTKMTYPVTEGPTARPGGFLHGHEYEYRVSAINAGGEGPQSAPVRVAVRYDKPGVPTDLRAAPNGDGTVQLNWTAPSENLWYWIYQRDITAGENEFTKLEYPITDGPVARPGGLLDGHEYEFKVAAINARGEGPASSAVSAKPMPVRPAQVVGLTATADDSGGITLNWTSVGHGVYYWIFRRDISAGETTYTRLGYPTEETTTTVRPLVNGHRYEFTVAASNLAGDGPTAAPVQAVARHAPPPAPGNLRGKATGDGAIELTWDAPTTDLYYWVYRRDVTAGETAFTKAGLPAGDPTVTISPLVHGHVYEFKVTAENAGGEGPASTPVRVTSLGGLPRPPTSLVPTVGNGQVSLSWTASPTSDVMYWIYYRDAAAGGGFTRGEYPASGTTATVSPLTNGRTYEFRVSAVNASGESAPSNVVTARPMPPRPTAPAGLHAVSGNGEVGLGWNQNSTAQRYNAYYRNTSAGQTGWTKAANSIAEWWYTVKPLANGSRYEFRITSVNAWGESPQSGVVSATPVPPAPQAPSGLRATAGNGQVSLAWNASPTPIVYYWVYYRPQGHSSWYYFAYPASGTSMVAKPLFNGFTYEFKVTAANLGGQSGFSNTVSARPLPPLPGTPTLSVQVSLSSGTIGLTWDSGGHTDGLYFWIEYCRCEQTGATWERSGYPIIANPNSRRYTWSTYSGMFGQYTTVYFRIIAGNLAGTRNSNIVWTKAWPKPEEVYLRFTTPTVAGNADFWYAKNHQSSWSIYGFDWFDNGCSAPLTGDRPAWAFSFRMPCVRHDFGYGNHRKLWLMSSDAHRARIDDTFKWDLQRYCNSVPNSLRGTCMNWAGIYYRMVRAFGGSHW